MTTKDFSQTILIQIKNHLPLTSLKKFSQTTFVYLKRIVFFDKFVHVYVIYCSNKILRDKCDNYNLTN